MDLIEVLTYIGTQNNESQKLWQTHNKGIHYIVLPYNIILYLYETNELVSRIFQINAKLTAAIIYHVFCKHKHWNKN